MRAYLLRRLLSVPIALLAIASFVFVAIRLAPGDPAEITMQQFATPEELARLRAEWGIDQPVWVQYLRFMANIARGNLGRSFIGNTNVTQEVLERFPATLELAVASIGVSAMIGVGLGTLAALHRGGWLDHISRVLALLGISTPIFWLGLMLIAFFSVELGWFPVSGRFDARDLIDPGPRLLILDAVLRADWPRLRSAVAHLALPAITMGFYSAGIVARFTRSAMLEVLRQEYVRTARAKGLPGTTVVYRHALRNALLPVVTILGLQFGNFLGGAAVTETVFAWPGLGRLLVDAIVQRDYPQVQASILVLAAAYVMVNLTVDLLYVRIDPRIRYS